MYKFKKGDCIIINGFRCVVKDTKEEKGKEYALVFHLQQLKNPKVEGKWLSQELLSPPIAHIDLNKHLKQ